MHKRCSSVNSSLYKARKSSADCDGDTAVTARIHSGWFKFRSLASFLTAKDVSLLLRGKVYDACVQSCMLHGSET